MALYCEYGARESWFLVANVVLIVKKRESSMFCASIRRIHAIAGSVSVVAVHDVSACVRVRVR